MPGTITIHGITKPVEFNVVYNGQAVTAMKKPTAGSIISGKIYRIDFGIGGPAITNGIGNEIELLANAACTVAP